MMKMMIMIKNYIKVLMMIKKENNNFNYIINTIKYNRDLYKIIFLSRI